LAWTESLSQQNFIGDGLAAVVAGAPAPFKLTKAVHHG
jgi:hypothetical protein